MSNSRRSAVSQNHVIVTQAIKGVVCLSIPALYIEVSGKPHIVSSLVRYLLSNPDRSLTWMKTRARVIGLFYDFCVAMKKNAITPMSYHDVLNRFCISIASGTIDPITGTDNLKLYWPPSSVENAKRLTRALQEFIEWCSYKALVPTDLVLRKDQLPTDEHSYLRYLHQAHLAKSFTPLGHTLLTSDVAKRISKLKQILPTTFSTNSYKTRSAKTFPDQYVSLLIKDGFIKNPAFTEPWEREDITAKMITILLLFGGTRNSEPYHLWFNDVIPQIDGSCKVFLRHPSEASTYLHGEEAKTRFQYLMEHGLLPRNNNSNSKSYKAGWKSLQVNEDFSAPIIFIHPAAEKMFRELYIIYIKKYRPILMKQRSNNGGYFHPFLFVNNWNGDIGAPYSIAAYKAALDRAYERINRIHNLNIEQSKHRGTSPHGMRHYYGQALVDLGVDQKIIQKCLHHRTIGAQSVYTEPNVKQIKSHLDNALKRIKDNESAQISKQTIQALTGDE